MTWCERISGRLWRLLTYVKEAAGMLQYQLTGVWLVLTVIHINVELVSLKKGRGAERMLRWCLLTEDGRQASQGAAILFRHHLDSRNDSHSPTWRSSDQHPPGVAHSSPAPSGKCCKHTNTHKHIVKDQTVRLISFFMHQLFSCFYYNRKPKKTKKNSEYKLAFPEIQQNKGTTKCLKHLKSVLYHPAG